MASERYEYDTISKDCSSSYRGTGNDCMFMSFYKNCFFFGCEDSPLSLNLNCKLE